MRCIVNYGFRWMGMAGVLHVLRRCELIKDKADFTQTRSDTSSVLFISFRMSLDQTQEE